MKNKWFLAFSVFLFSTLQLAAQNTRITGAVIDKQSRVPIEFASISILQPTDSSILAGVLTNHKGAFLLPNLVSGNYLLKVVSIGYRTVLLPFSVVANQQQLVLTGIELESTGKTLGDVVVTGRRNTVSNKLDRQTYRADQFESAKGGNATDILKNLPSVSVNSAGEISVRGSGGFLVLINGKPIVTDAQTILSQIPANSIENIELITAPSAKYDADGKAGIINITTKKGSTDGLAIQTNIQSGLPATTTYQNLEKPVRFGGDITLNYKKNKWDLSLSGNYNRNDQNGEREGDVYTLNAASNTITRFPSIGERSFDRYNYGARTALTFTPDKQNSFSIGFFTSKKYQQRRADIVYANTTSDLLTGSLIRQLTYFNSNLQTKEGSFALGSADYSHSFAGGSKLSASAIYEYANLYGNTLNRNLDYPAKNVVFQTVTNPYTNPIHGYRLQLDYSITMGTGKLETGYQFRNDRQNGTFGYTVSPATNQTDSAKFRGTATSVNQINGLYAQYSGKTDKLQYTAGLRYETASREVNLSADSKPHLLKLRNLFPSVNLLYGFSNSWSAKAGYSKRVQRNNNFELNPIPEREHSETLEQGDPDLLPQFTDLAELGVNHRFQNGTFLATLYYQHTKNPIQRVNSVYTDTILNRLFTNAAQARLIGLEIGANYKPANWLTSYLGVNLYNYAISGVLNVLGTSSFVNNANWVYSINMNHTFNLGKNWNLQANVNYLSNRPTAQGEDGGFLSPNSSVKKTFGNGKCTLGLQWQNMNLGFMNANRQRITTWGKNFYTTTNYIYETDVFVLNFSFNLNKLSGKTKLPASELGEKEF